MTLREADSPTKIRRLAHVVPSASGLALREKTFYWKTQDKYIRLNKFKTEVRAYS